VSGRAAIEPFGPGMVVEERPEVTVHVRALTDGFAVVVSAPYGTSVDPMRSAACEVASALAAGYWESRQ